METNKTGKGTVNAVVRARRELLKAAVEYTRWLDRVSDGEDCEGTLATQGEYLEECAVALVELRALARKAVR